MRGHSNSVKVFIPSLILALSLLCLASPAAAQNETPDVWEDGYGEAGSVFSDATETDDGYVYVGNTEVDASGGTGASSTTVGWVVKTNRSGGVVWNHAFEERLGSSLYGVTRTDNGYVAVGMYGADSLLNLRQAWAVGLSENGTVEWVSDSFQGRNRFNEVVTAGDAGTETIALGTGNGRRRYAVRLDAAGDVVWERAYADGTIRSATDEGLVFAGKGERDYGSIESAEVTDATANGSIEWQRFYEETEVNFRQGNPGGEDIIALDEGYAVASGEQVIRTGPDGDVLWTTEVSQGGVISALAPTPNDTGVLAAVKIGDSPHLIGPGEARSLLVRVSEEGAQWSLGSGLSGNLGQIREIIPLANGYYHLSGTSAVGESYDHTGYAYVADLQPPSVELRATPTSGEIGETTFTVTANATDNGESVEYRWDFDGDGSTERVTNESTVTRTYTQLGEFEPTVTVVDASRNNDTATTTVETVDTTPPTTGLAAPDPPKIGTSAPVLLDASASSDNGEIVEYRWDFDDDGTVENVTQSPRTRHDFSGGEGGSTTVGLRVVDAAGNVDTGTFTLEVAEPPTISVRREWLADDAIRLEASVSDFGDTPTVRWTDPEGETTTEPIVNYTADDEGEQVFRVVVEDQFGARNATNVTVEFEFESEGDDGFGPGFGMSDALVAITVLALLLGRGRADCATDSR